MRLLHRAPATVHLSIDETAVLIGLLDDLVDPDLQTSADVHALVARTRRRLSQAMAEAGGSPSVIDVR